MIAKKNNNETSVFVTYQYFLSLAIIFLVNIRYVICNIFDIPTLPLTLLITTLLFTGINYKKIRKPELLLTLLMFFLTVLNIGALSILSFILFCFICKKLDYLIRANLIIMCSLLLYALIAFKLGITNDHIVENAIKIGHTLGFSNPNILSLYVYSIIITLYALTSNKNFLIYIIILFLSYITYKYTGSRSCLIGTGVLILSDICIRLLPKAIIRSKWILYLFPLTLVCASIYFSLHYKEYFLLDVLLSGRLSIIGSILNNISLHQYLTGFPWPPEVPQDNAFITIISSGGLIGLWVYSYWYKKYVNYVRYLGLWSLPIILSILLYGLTEYVFVGLNMISITICLIVKKIIYNANLVNNSSCLQCRQIS